MSMPGTIRRSASRARWTVVNNALINDDRISFEAVGVLVYLLSKPDDWIVMTADLCRRGGCGSHKLGRIMAELQSAGYVTLEYARAEDGSMAGRRYVVSEDGAGHNVTDVAVSRTSGKPERRENPNVGKPPHIVSTDVIPNPDFDLPNRDTPSAGGMPPNEDASAIRRAARHTLATVIAEDVGAPAGSAVRRDGTIGAQYGRLIGDLCEAGGGYDGAFMAWDAFKGSIPPAEWERFGSIQTIAPRFNRWRANGGARVLTAIRADVERAERVRAARAG